MLPGREFSVPDVMLFNASPLPTFLLDGRHLRVLAANPAAEERYGYSTDALRTFTLEDLVDPEDSSASGANRELGEEAAVRLLRQRHRRKDGTVFSAYCAFRTFDVGAKRYVLLVATELSELRMADAEERFVEKMDAMRRLGGGVAHEFNNLLTAILATADLALESADMDESLRADLRSIRQAGLRAAATTRQLLAFSGSQVISPRDTNVNNVLEQLAPLVRHVLPPRIDLKLDLKATAHVWIDPARFEQAVLNLVLNAVDAMPRGGTLTITTGDSHTFVTIIVGDSGSGMDETILARLFEPFHSTKGPSAGRGLGLASVWGTVRQMEGSIDIESAVGQGTRVRMFFPRAITPIELDAIPAPAGLDVTGGEVILVVDDEPSVRAPICRKLRTEGYFVLEADNGNHALSVIGHHPTPIHLVITDVVMPEMDGGQLVTQLREWYPRTRALFMSGYSPQYFATQEGSRVQGSEFLGKPFDLHTLSRRVRAILDAEWDDA